MAHKNITVRVDDDLHRRIRKIALLTLEEPMQQIFHRLLVQWCDEQEGKIASRVAEPRPGMIKSADDLDAQPAPAPRQTRVLNDPWVYAELERLSGTSMPAEIGGEDGKLATTIARKKWSGETAKKLGLNLRELYASAPPLEPVSSPA